MELISNPTMAQRWREESFHRLISGRDHHWRAAPAPVRTRPPDFATNGRIVQPSFTRVILPSSVPSRCSSQHAARFAVERGWLYHRASIRQCRQRRALHEQMSARLRPWRNPARLCLGNGCFGSGRSNADGTSWSRRTIRTFRENHRSFRGLASCDIAPVWQCAAAPIYCVASRRIARRVVKDFLAAHHPVPVLLVGSVPILVFAIPSS
jgi:hypothetical protein